MYEDLKMTRLEIACYKTILWIMLTSRKIMKIIPFIPVFWRSERWIW